MPTDPKRPYPKFNLLSRKKKDEKNLDAMKKAMSSGGSYSFIKKSKKPLEVAPGKVATKRGSEVKGSSKTTSKFSGPPAKVTSGVAIGKTTKDYTPADVRTGHAAYGKESKTKPTPQFVKDAQAKKQDIVHKGGKPYRAGFTTIKKEPDQFKMSVKTTMPKLERKTTETVTVKNPKPKGSRGESFPKRKIPRVEFLRNKDAKGVTTGERKRKKTQSGY